IAGIFIFLFIFLLVKLFPFYRAVFSFIGQLLAPFIVACLIAYLLYPIIKKILHYNFPKSVAILIIYLFFFVGGFYFIFLFFFIYFFTRKTVPFLSGCFFFYRAIISTVYRRLFNRLFIISDYQKNPSL